MFNELKNLFCTSSVDQPLKPVSAHWTEYHTVFLKGQQFSKQIFCVTPNLESKQTCSWYQFLTKASVGKKQKPCCSWSDIFQGHSVFFNSCVEFSAAIGEILEEKGCLKKKLERATTVFWQNVMINKQKRSKDKSQLLKGPPRFYKFFYLPFTSSALPSFAKKDSLLIYFVTVVGRRSINWSL